MTAWAQDAAEVEWGLAGRAATVATAARDGRRVVDHLWPDGRPTGPQVSSWRELRQVLRDGDARARGPAFTSTQSLQDELAIPLGVALERDAGVRARLTRLGAVIAFVTHDPAARLTFDLRQGQGNLACGQGPPVADIEISCSGDDLLALLEGRMDLARDALTGRLRVTGSPAAALSTLAVLTAWTRRLLAPACRGRR